MNAKLWKGKIKLLEGKYFEKTNSLVGNF